MFTSRVHTFTLNCEVLVGRKYNYRLFSVAVVLINAVCMMLSRSRGTRGRMRISSIRLHGLHKFSIPLSPRFTTSIFFSSVLLLSSSSNQRLQALPSLTSLFSFTSPLHFHLTNTHFLNLDVFQSVIPPRNPARPSYLTINYAENAAIAPSMASVS